MESLKLQDEERPTDVEGVDSELAAILRKDYAYFSISPRTGFLDIENTAIRLPSKLAESSWEDALVAAKCMCNDDQNAESALMEPEAWGHWRHLIHNMVIIPHISPALLGDQSLLRRAYVVLCMLGHLYLHGPHPFAAANQKDLAFKKGIIPTSIATPWLMISEALGLKPVLSYASQVTWNCTSTFESFTEDLPYSQQIRVLETFTEHPSEIAFVMGPARVEIEGATILRSIFESIFLLHLQSKKLELQHQIILELRKIETALGKMKDHLLVLKKDCDPIHFYWKLRPWIAGSGPEGWTYKVGEADVKMVVPGSTAGSSPLLQALDSFLGVQMSDSQLDFRCSMQDCMPRHHRLLVRKLEDLNENDKCSFRSYVTSHQEGRENTTNQDNEAGRALIAQYNSVLLALKQFRDQHFQIVSLFIINQASKAQRVEQEQNTERGETQPARRLQGTGGSDLARLLRSYRDSSYNARLTMDTKSL